MLRYLVAQEPREEVVLRIDFIVWQHGEQALCLGSIRDAEFQASMKVVLAVLDATGHWQLSSAMTLHLSGPLPAGR
jgi:hypothetical protein